MERTDWGFADRDDAARYLDEVRRLWSAWMLGLAGLLLAQNWWVIVAGVVTIGLLIFMARPLQRRSAKLIPEDTLVGGRFNVVGKGTARDDVLKQFAYGRAPLEAAVALTNSGRWLVTARLIVIGATVVAFAFVIATAFTAAP